MSEENMCDIDQCCELVYSLPTVHLTHLFKLKGLSSDSSAVHKGAPHGSVLAPFIYFLISTLFDSVNYLRRNLLAYTVKGLL